MLKVAVVGGGGHSRGNHLPAVARYRDLHPGEIELTAFCDIDATTAERLARDFRFERSYIDVNMMLNAERLDACIAVTPVSVTARVATEILSSAGIALLMEKPPGATPAETAQICELVARLDARVMVSMNRRFDPALTAARDWLKEVPGGTPLEHLRASMLRHDRTEPGFIAETAIHCVDAMRSIAGDIRDYAVLPRQVSGVWWYHVDLTFDRGATGSLDVMPTCGCLAESYELFCAGRRAIARVAEFDNGTFIAWEKNEIIEQADPTEDLPGFVRNGTYAETVAFFEGVKNKKRLHPSPAEVRQSVEICHAIRRQVVDREALPATHSTTPV